MAVCYNKLWKLLIDRKMKKKDLSTLSGVSKSTLAKMANNEHVSTEIVAKFAMRLMSVMKILWKLCNKILNVCSISLVGHIT